MILLRFLMALIAAAILGSVPAAADCLDSAAEFSCGARAGSYAVVLAPKGANGFRPAAVKVTVLTPGIGLLGGPGYVVRADGTVRLTLTGGAPGAPVTLALEATASGRGSAPGLDLCCDGEITVTMPAGLSCAILPVIAPPPKVLPEKKILPDKKQPEKKKPEKKLPEKKPDKKQPEKKPPVKTTPLEPRPSCDLATTRRAGASCRCRFDGMVAVSKTSCACGKGKAFRAGRGCVALGPKCPKGTRYSDRRDRCEPVCREGAVYDAQTNSCARLTPDCRKGARFVPRRNRCEPVCRRGAVYDPETNSCEQLEQRCPRGTVLVDGECEPRRIRCRPPAFFDPDEGRCIRPRREPPPDQQDENCPHGDCPGGNEPG